MTNQIQGEILYAGASNICTAWLPVRGDRATFGVDVIALNGTGVTLEWSVESRTRENPLPSGYTDPVAVTAVGTAGPSLEFSLSSDLCQELVRYKFSVTGTESTASFVVFRALQPSWQSDR